MAKKKMEGNEEQRRQKARAARSRGRAPSEIGGTQVVAGSPSRAKHKLACRAPDGLFPPEMASLSPHQLIVLGPPGAGKGTQADRLAACLGLEHISPGEILRREIPADSVTGQRIRELMAAGELVPDELIDGFVRDHLEALGPEQGFVLDGYPRTAAEAHSLRELLARLGRLEPRPLVVWLEVPRNELVRRLRRRRELEGRADDAKTAFARRLAIHDAHAGRVRDALGSWTDVVVIDGSRAVDAVTEEILDCLYLIQTQRARRAAHALQTSEV